MRHEIAVSILIAFIFVVTIFSIISLIDLKIERERLSMTPVERIEQLEEQRINDKHCQPNGQFYRQCNRMYDQMVQDELRAQYEKN
jgi:hypothetical protein